MFFLTHGVRILTPNEVGFSFHTGLKRWCKDRLKLLPQTVRQLDVGDIIMCPNLSNIIL